MPDPRILPGAENRATYLDDLGRDDLRAEADLLDAALADLRAKLDTAEGNAAEALTQALDELRAEMSADLANLQAQLDAKHASMEAGEARHAEAIEELRAKLISDHAAEAAAIVVEHEVAREKAEAALAAAKLELEKAPDTRGLEPVALHVRGAAFNGTEIRLVRVGLRGPLADKWQIRIGNKMLTRHGHRIPFQLHRHTIHSLQEKILFTLDEAVETLKNERA